MRKLTRFLAIIGMMTFGLNLLWENIQCRLFFIHAVDHCRWFMVGAALGDVLLTLAAWYFLAFLVGDLLWFTKNWDLSQWIGMETIGVILALTAEVFALTTNRWAYTTLNPLIPILSVSLIPVLQLIMIFPLIFIVGGKVFKQLEKKSDLGVGNENGTGFKNY